MNHAAALAPLPAAPTPSPRGATIIQLPRPAAPRTTEWRDHGSCKDADPEMFFPETAAAEKDALSLCAQCPDWVRSACLEYALTQREPHGVWGGMTSRQRRRAQTTRAASPKISAVQARAKRNELIAQARREGMSIETVAARFKVSRSLIYRVQDQG